MARPHLMFFDARLIFFIILFVFHIRWWTFGVLVCATVGFTGASYFNYSLENVVRLMRSKLVGSFRPAAAYTRLRPMADFGSDALRADYSGGPHFDACTMRQISRSNDSSSDLKPVGDVK